MDAIKLQAYIGTRDTVDLRGGEPQDEHWTLLEIDPATPEQVAYALNSGGCLDGFLKDVIGKLQPAKFLEGLVGKEINIGVFVMDGDGRV